METLRIALTALRAHKLRSFLTLLGVIIGVMTVVAVVSIINGLNAYVTEQIFSLNPDVFVVTQFGIITSREEFLEALKRKRITLEDADAVERLCVGCAEVGVLNNTSQTVKRGAERLPDVGIIGGTANIAGLIQPRPRGRPLLHRHRGPPRRAGRGDRRRRARGAVRQARSGRPPGLGRGHAVQGDRTAAQAGLGARPEPGQAARHPARRLPQAVRAAPERGAVRPAARRHGRARGDPGRGPHHPALAPRHAVQGQGPVRAGHRRRGAATSGSRSRPAPSRSSPSSPASRWWSAAS